MKIRTHRLARLAQMAWRRAPAPPPSPWRNIARMMADSPILQHLSELPAMPEVQMSPFSGLAHTDAWMNELATFDIKLLDVPHAPIYRAQGRGAAALAYGLAHTRAGTTMIERRLTPPASTRANVAPDPLWTMDDFIEAGERLLALDPPAQDIELTEAEFNRLQAHAKSSGLLRPRNDAEFGFPSFMGLPIVVKKP